MAVATARRQGWAVRAAQRVELRAAEAGREAYRSRAVSVPALIRQSGLCQTLAFLQAKASDKDKAGYADYLEDLAYVLGRHVEDLAREAREAAPMAYLLTQRQVLEAALWLKRYAEAYIPEGQGGD